MFLVWPLDIGLNFGISDFQANLGIRVWGIPCEIAFRLMSLDRTNDKSSGNGLVPSGSKPLSEPMLSQFYVAIRRHEATMS